MSTIVRDYTRPALMLLVLGYLVFLTFALIWMHVSPEIVLALTVGGASLVVIALRPVVALHAFIFLLNIEFVFVSEEGMTNMKAVGVLIVSAWLLSTATQKRFPVRFDFFLLSLLAFLAWAGIATIYAYDDRLAVARVLTFVQLGVAALMFRSVVDSADRLRSLYWALVLWILLSTIIAIAGYVLGFTRVASGLMHDRNMLAGYIDIAVVCDFMLLQTASRGLPRLFLWLALPVFLIGLALTFSRTGLIVLVIALLAVWFRIAREKGFVILTLSGAIVCLTIFLLPDIFWRRVATIAPSIEEQTDTFGVRVRLWQVGLHMIRQHPLTGVGPGNFVAAFPRYSRGEEFGRHLDAHSAYVEVGSEMGLVGLALFLTINGLALRYAARGVEAGRRRGSADLRALAAAVEIGLLAMLVGAVTGDAEGIKILWVFYGLAAAVGDLAREAPAREPMRRVAAQEAMT